MSRQRSFRRLRLAALVAVVAAHSLNAAAHTTVMSTATEGVRADNALRIGHGCEGSPVIAQSAVFPTDAPVLTTSDPDVTLSDLGEVITQGTVVGLIGAIQSRDIFELQEPKLDSAGNTIGFHAWRGLLREGMRGRVPFEFTAPNFVPESCAASLRIEIAVADICRVKRPVIQAGKLNLWIPDNGSEIATLANTAGVEGVGSPARLTVQRDLAKNPLPGACGAGFVVTVTPSAEQIDRDLPIGSHWRVR